MSNLEWLLTFGDNQMRSPLRDENPFLADAPILYDIIRTICIDLYDYIPEMRTSPCHHLHSHPGYLGVNVHSTPFEYPTVSLRIGPHGAPRAAEQQRKSFSSGTSG
jgi:hypothetical protein